MGFCWDCGRYIGTHHERCKNNPLNMGPNPVFQQASSPPPEVEEMDPNDPTAPSLKKQRLIRTCLTIWVSIICSGGLLAIILAFVFASQLRQAFNPRDYETLKQLSIACGAVGGVLSGLGIILAITWCSMSCQCCCCKKTWICKCCR
jgi:hypothetical protein